MWLGFPFLMGSSFLVLLPALALAIYAQYKVRSTYARYSRVETARRITAGQMAKRILEGSGITNVTIGAAKGPLADNYDPRKKILHLSAPESTSVAAVGVAAHEAGHAIQHARDYKPLSLRTAIVPIANIGSQMAFPLFFLGLIFRYQAFITIGIFAFSAAVLFTLVTLPVEFDASRRAVASLRQSGLVTDEEVGGVKEVLFAAALTYVAAAAMAALQLLMLLSFNRRR
ncbi:MAG: zinc metallopeptidase [Candidatus Bipolaricaulota bacterium]|nr:zinc metallopeptidase [Candidatus Bipolaricaulota bacterium]